jgi:PIN domain nuclease of toxin-antitoxin system
VSAVLDAWALVALLADETGARRVEELLSSDGAVAVCAINLGEVLYRQIRALGLQSAREAIALLRRELTVVDADWDLVASASALKARGGLSYADAFCVATALRLHAPVWTGDGEIVALAGEVEVVDLRG